MNILAAPFHEDELAAQRLSGLDTSAGAIRDFLPEQHRLFFEGLRYLLVGVLDAQGWPLATILSAEPGFVRASGARTLAIRGSPAATDPAAPGIAPKSDIALLGIDLATRRRNRANGIILEAGAPGFSMLVRQSFGNCPKYIHRRSVEPITRKAGAVQILSELTAPARAMIAGADTFFVASRSRPQIRELGRVDISHRGGLPGFVTIDAQDGILVPDYPGNRYFNTLGNLLGDPRAALLFIDFESGDVLQLQGRVTIQWSAAGSGSCAGGRSWRFQTDRAWWRRAALELRWHSIDDAPFPLSTPVAAMCAPGPAA